MKLLASFLVLSSAEFSVPTGVIPGTTADCLKDGVNQCIECIGCTYFNFDGQDQGGTNCRAGPFDGIQAIPYYREWCRNNNSTASSDYAGINQDFHDLECADDHTKIRTFCTVRVEARTDNDHVDYRIRRGVRGVRAQVYDDGSLGLPILGGRYEMQSLRRATVHCLGDNCNEIEVADNAPPQTREPRHESFQCKSCRYTKDADGNVDNEDCLTNPSLIESEECFYESEEPEGSGQLFHEGGEKGCMLRAERSCNNFQGGNEFCSNQNEWFVRGCSDYEGDLTRTETDHYQYHEQGCAEYDRCNSFSVQIDPDDIGVLPRAGVWRRPLTENEQTMYCGFSGEECISCEVCTGVSCGQSNGIQNNDNDILVYRRRYYDEGRGVWMRNICQTRVVEGVSDDGETYWNEMYRTVAQITDDEFDTDMNKALASDGIQWGFCGTEKCGEVHSHEPETRHNEFNYGTEIECLLCSGDSCSDHHHRHEIETESCPTGVCQHTITHHPHRHEPFEERSCLRDENMAKFVATNNIEQTTDNGKSYSCYANRCNIQHVAGNEIKLEEEYSPEKALPVTDEAACFDPNGADGNTDLCHSCVSCSYFIDSNGVEIGPEASDCANSANNMATALYFKTSPGYTGPIENYCGVHVERQVSTTGWKYRIQRGGLEYVNPVHVGGVSTKIQQTRSALFVCEEDNCNSYGTQYWPLPPLILPRKSPRHDDGSHIHCIQCNETDPDCFENAEITGDMSCPPDGYCAALYTENFTKNDVGFWVPDEKIQRECYSVADEIVSYEYVIRDIETYACSGDTCNSMEMANTHLPPLSPLPKDQDRWEEPLSPSEVSLYCGSGVECIECFSCLVPFVDNQPSTYECEQKTYRKVFIKGSADNLVENVCSTAVSYSINDACETTRSIQKGVSQVPVGEANEPGELVEETEMKLVKASMCKQCSSIAECASSEVTCKPNNDLCWEKRFIDHHHHRHEVENTLMEAGCADGVMEILYDRNIDTIKYNMATTTCDGESCNSVGSESVHVPSYECETNDPDAPVTEEPETEKPGSNAHAVLPLLNLIFITMFA